jgi:ActR/RegA family two-component response regulator
MITGYATVYTAVEAVKLGVEYYIKKPFKPDEIIDAVQNILNKGKKQYTASNKKSVQQGVIVREQILEVLKPHFVLSKRN